jgi:hypothetical protein
MLLLSVHQSSHQKEERDKSKTCTGHLLQLFESEHDAMLLSGVVQVPAALNAGVPT